MTVHLMQSAAIGCLLLLHVCQSSRGQDPAGPQPPTRPSHHLSFDWKVGGPILLPVSIDGEFAEFIFDTGATHHLLSDDYESRLGDQKRYPICRDLIALSATVGHDPLSWSC